MKNGFLIGLCSTMIISCAGSFNNQVIQADKAIPVTSTRLIATNTTRIIDSELISIFAAREVGEIVNLQSGVDNGRVRGGRSGEILYYLDGVPVKDLYSGGNFIESDNQRSLNEAAIMNDINSNHSNSSSAYYDRIRVYRSSRGH
ncbi:MAG: hypothetical protein H8E74_10865 [Gammaproteobacteria bacterium]|jgi:hypothetical protein|nr:hypothetical protein [Gammaproteobacteria bacterium]MBT3728087.1 hypothetical protein [Candidatus Neomarinimicrobiota bacterium]MBT4317172.1 hypothetical protein [Candidatus Neomarinimicrobiota bacterium]